ncbi:hypothetical protein QYS62_005125 [Fusarium acuminatum]|uniref:Protein kinase domain-containing protein n=1 Tax=Fusarium acuminatum TaxID=5515 RepID=A0ABZ2WTX8_9HYPO
MELGAVSLAFQLFSGCIKGYQLLIEAKDMPKKHEYLRLRMQLEQYKLLDWAAAASVINGDQDREVGLAFPGPHLDRTTTVAALKQTKSLLLDLESMRLRYKLALMVEPPRSVLVLTETQTEAIPSPGFQASHSSRDTLRQRALRCAELSSTYPRGLRWAVFDANKFEALLARLAELNSTMLKLLDAHQTRHLIKLQHSTHMQVLQTHSRLDELLLLLQSLGSESFMRRQEPPLPRDPETQHVAELARFKALKVAVETNVPRPVGGLDTMVASVLDIAHLQLNSAEHSGNSKPGRVGAAYDNAPVWVEWKYYDDREGTLAPGEAENRISQLSILLQNQSKPAHFRVPQCVGYVHDQRFSRLGLVFTAGSSICPSSKLGGPLSLYDAFQGAAKPSLSLRLKMAKQLAASVRYLHAANWLHKGLRSENVVFEGSGDLSSPSLWGFDYSRPSTPGEVTELQVDNRHHELYRHPDVQFDVPRDGRYGFSKEHDIYSLGVILYEIGVWRPVHDCLGISLNQLIRRPVIQNVKFRLLDAQSIALLQGEAGDLFAEATHRCLESEGGEEVVFWERTLDMLDRISV